MYADRNCLFVVYLTTLLQYLRLYSVDFYSILIRLPSSSEASETRVRNMAAEFCRRSICHARRVLLHAVNLRHETDGFTSPPKEGALRILSPLKSIVLGRVWTREPWVQWQARWPLDHRGRPDRNCILLYATEIFGRRMLGVFWVMEIKMSER
jgi:hypothetical protein